MKDWSDEAVSVTSAVDGGYTAGERKFLNASPTPVHTDAGARLLSDETNRSSIDQSNVDVLTGVGYHFTASDSQEESLDELIRSSFEKYGGPDANTDKIWLPYDKRLQLVDEFNVHRELSKLPPEYLTGEQLAHYVKIICSSVSYSDKHGHELKTSCRSIFAILALCDMIRHSLKFVDKELSDRYLPLKRIGQSNRLESSRSPGRSWTAVGWKGHQIDSFLNYQKYMLSPFFKIPPKESKDVFFYELDPGVVLPFVKIGDKKQHGHHGSVYMVKIHPSHHDAPHVRLPFSSVKM